MYVYFYSPLGGRVTLTLHKALVQKRLARSISGHQGTFDHFQASPYVQYAFALENAQSPLAAPISGVLNSNFIQH